MTAFITTLLFMALYFLPTIVAASKHRANGGAICALNFLLGWTILGWIGALVWALTDGPTEAA